MAEIREMLLAKDRAGFSKHLSWRTVANMLNSLPMGICECETGEDAKGYTKFLLLLFSAVAIGGWMEGGAA